MITLDFQHLKDFKMVHYTQQWFSHAKIHYEFRIGRSVSLQVKNSCITFQSRIQCFFACVNQAREIFIHRNKEKAGARPVHVIPI